VGLRLRVCSMESAYPRARLPVRRRRRRRLPRALVCLDIIEDSLHETLADD